MYISIYITRNEIEPTLSSIATNITYNSRKITSDVKAKFPNVDNTILLNIVTRMYQSIDDRMITYYIAPVRETMFKLFFVGVEYINVGYLKKLINETKEVDDIRIGVDREFDGSPFCSYIETRINVRSKRKRDP